MADHAQAALTTDAVQTAEPAAIPQSESPAPVEHWGLAGSMDGHQVEMKLKLMEGDKFNLVNRGFHWINEYPFQR